MSSNTLFDKVWNLHKVCELPGGDDQLFIGLHLIHEVTSPQAFQMLREKKLQIKYPDRTFATVDHIVPTKDVERPFTDTLAENMLKELEKNTKEFGLTFFSLKSGKQGIVHVIGPELGLTQPGMTIACGDSHTSTHGAFGSIGFGIGTSQIRDVLATQCITLKKPKLRRITVDGVLHRGVYAKDIILRIIGDLGVMGGIGYAYEYGGSALDAMSMEGRMTICNMSIEGGARFGYVNPDETTYAFIEGRDYAPKGEAFEKAQEFWRSLPSGSNAVYDDEYRIDADSLEPMVTWGITPGHTVGLEQAIPSLEAYETSEEKQLVQKALRHMKFSEGEKLTGKKINVAFIGSCTNGRLSDLQEAARILKGKKVASHVHAFVVPGSMQVARAAEAEGLPHIFEEAGFEWRALVAPYASV